MPLWKILGLPRGAGRNLNSGLGNAQKWESSQAEAPEEDDQGTEWQELLPLMTQQ